MEMMNSGEDLPTVRKKFIDGITLFKDNLVGILISIWVFDAEKEARFNAIVKEVEKYRKLSSYTHVGNLDEDDE